MLDTYKFDPENFTNVLGLSDELRGFYELFEAYKKDESVSSRFSFEKQGRDLFFTIKHRELEGWITQITASEMRDYMEELLHD